MTDEQKELLKKSEFQDEGHGTWSKFDGDKEFYIEVKESGFLHMFSYMPQDEYANDIEEESVSEEKLLKDIDLYWFESIDY